MTKLLNAIRTRGSIARRISVAISVLILILLLNLGVSALGSLKVGALSDQIQQRDVPLSSDGDGLLAALSQEATAVRGYRIAPDPALLESLHSGQSSFATLSSSVRKLTNSQAVMSSLAALESQVAAWDTQYVAPSITVNSAQTSAQKSATALTGNQLFSAIQTTHTHLYNAIVTEVDADFAQEASVRVKMVLTLLITSIIGGAISIVVLLFTLRYIVRPVAGLREVARAMHQRAPTASTTPPRPPELREVYDAILAAGRSLQEREDSLAHANEELTRASHMKSEFLATMSHELRTPLNAILGFTDLVRTGATGDISPQTEDYLERVRRNGSVLLDLINDVLDLSKIEAGRVSVNHDVIAPDSLVRGVVANVHSLADAKSIRVDVDSVADGPLALGDNRAVRQILTNLIGNAVKFTNEGSVKVSVRADGHATVIEVADTGPGIASEDRAAIFEPFRQVGAHARTGTGGTGLGLAISVRLARLMGGDITVESELGAGSRFVLRLPAVTTLSLPTGSSLPVILAVDDDLDALSLWQAQVERMGFDFVGVQSRSAALEAAVSLQPAAILLDIVLPDGNGWEILGQLRSNPRTADIPVCVVSVVDGADRAEHATVSFLQKPASEDQLRDVLERYLRVPAGVTR
jgi:signal transduction histidine kinase